MTGSNAKRGAELRMNLQAIIQGLAITDRRGRFENEIGGLVDDSRKVKAGDAFVAVRGLAHDGHLHVKEALERGAVAVIAEEWDPEHDGLARGVDVALIPDSRRSLGLLAANFHGQPSRQLHIAAVTGTNGKTTTTHVLESIIRASGRKVGVIGTVETRYGEVSLNLGHTTPRAVDLHEILSDMVAAGVTHAVMEVSSHALDQHRAAGIHFKVAAFTNLSQDHLDYHKSLETYFEAKARLFSDVLPRSEARGKAAVSVVDDPRGEEILGRFEGKGIRVSAEPGTDAEVGVVSAEFGLGGTKAVLNTPKGELEIETALVGPHNLANVCLAVGMAIGMGFSKTRIQRGVAAVERVPGRLERIPDEKGRVVFVDYAHTPDALSRVTEALAAPPEGRLVVVFGAGGDRDAEKRGPMGEAVAASAKIAFVTNDNPRTEDPAAIAEALVKGLEAKGFSRAEGTPAEGQVAVEFDRQAAIRAAVELIGPQDVLLIAGKGHETTQAVGEDTYRFDDRAVVTAALTGEPALELELLPPPVLAAPRVATVTVGVDDVLDEAVEAEVESEEEEVLPTPSVAPEEASEPPATTEDETPTLSDEMDASGSETPTLSDEIGASGSETPTLSDASEASADEEPTPDDAGEVRPEDEDSEDEKK